MDVCFRQDWIQEHKPCHRKSFSWLCFSLCWLYSQIGSSLGVAELAAGGPELTSCHLSPYQSQAEAHCSYMVVKVAQSCPTLWTPWTIQFMEFSRPEYWSGLPCPPPRDLPNPGIKPRSPELPADSLPTEPPGKPLLIYAYP